MSLSALSHSWSSNLRIPTPKQDFDMTVVNSGKILVTGASGYIGSWIVKTLVDRGYSVVVAVRSQHHVDFITKRFPEYEGKVTGVVVPDIGAPGAYDDAVKDVDGIIHAASPATLVWNDPSEIIDPAVNSVKGILGSAAKFGKNVKRVVLCSSSSSITSGDAGERTRPRWSETDWNEISPKEVQEQGKASNPFAVYDASKTLAERAAWDFVKNEKPAFDLTAILPTFNFGPYIHEAPKERGVGSTPSMFLYSLTTGGVTAGNSWNWVDVRDVALHHVLALSTPEAGGERISSTAGTFSWQAVYDVLHDAGYKNIIGKETYGKGEAVTAGIQDNAKSLRIFPGSAYRPLTESVRDMAESLTKGGFLE